MDRTSVVCAGMEGGGGGGGIVELVEVGRLGDLAGDVCVGATGEVFGRRTGVTGEDSVESGISRAVVPLTGVEREAAGLMMANDRRVGMLKLIVSGLKRVREGGSGCGLLQG